MIEATPIAGEMTPPQKAGHTKKDLADEIAARLGVKQPLVLEVIDRAMAGILDVIEREGKIELRNFGVFRLRRTKPRVRRNPRTGETFDHPGSIRMSFSPGKNVRRRFEGAKP